MSEFKMLYSECESEVRVKDLNDEDVRKLEEIANHQV